METDYKEMYIKFIANYLRKSRGEDETALNKHRMQLRELCEKNNWKYVEYIELESGDSIADRPVFIKLLKEIETGMYDAIAVVEYDRLGRGDKGDQDVIEKILKKTNTLIITPSKTYDLSNEEDEFSADVNGLFARREYKMIKKRLSMGKKVGARRGDWTNGTPPFPYKYEPSRKGLVVNEENKKIYIEMKEMFYGGKSFEEITWHLNKQTVLSPRGGFWHENTIRRIMIDETHMGRIISNKSTGSGHKKKKDKTPLIHLPRSEWVIVENCHEILKSEEEHKKILSLIHSKTKFHHSAQRGAFIFSGILYCGICGKSMQMQNRPDMNTVLIKPCNKGDHFGKKCYNKGNKIDMAIKSVIYILECQAIEIQNNDETIEKVDYDSLVKTLNIEIKKHNEAIERIKDTYDEGGYTKDERNTRIEKRNSSLNKLQSQIENYKILKENQENMTSVERTNKIKSLINIMNDDSSPVEVKNHLLKEIINKIIYIKYQNGDSPTISCVLN